MTKIKNTLAALALAVAFALPVAAFADEIVSSTVGLQGYDPVGYFADGKPEKGNGNHIASYDGVNYLFASDEHKKQFEANPEKYAPQYGGWCAYGTSVHKKFVGDPTVWKIVDGKLYVNLDKKIYDIWVKDIPGNIQKANENWPQIKDVAASELNKS